jgi:hypothetical protein
MKRNFLVVVAIIVGTFLPINSFGQPDSIDYKISPFQVTFLFPPFSTNGMDNANYVNNLSINIYRGLRRSRWY